MDNYFYVISGVIILLAILENIIPNSTSGKSVKTVISIIGVLVILSPIVKIFKGEENEYVESGANYNQYLEKYQNNLTEKSVKLLLETEGYYVDSIEVLGEYSDNGYTVNKITIKLENLVINDNSEHIIVIEKIETLIAERLNILKAEIIIDK